MIVLACFVIPASAAIMYAVDGIGGLLVAVIVSVVILAAVWWRLRKIDTRR